MKVYVVLSMGRKPMEIRCAATLGHAERLASEQRRARKEPKQQWIRCGRTWQSGSAMVKIVETELEAVEAPEPIY